MEKSDTIQTNIAQIKKLIKKVEKHVWDRNLRGVADLTYSHFIDKACEYLEENLMSFWTNEKCCTKSFIKEFRDAMEEDE